MPSFTEHSSFEKHLVKQGLVRGRSAAHEAVLILKSARSAAAAEKLLSRFFPQSKEIAALSYESRDLFWKGKQIVNWDGSVSKATDLLPTEGRKPSPFDGFAKSLLDTRLTLAGIEARWLRIKATSSLMQSSGIGEVYKFAPNDTGAIRGLASTSAMDSVGHVVLDGAFSDAIKDRGLTGPRGIKLLLDHDWSKPAGAITRLAYGPSGLEIAAQLSLDIPYVKDRYAAIKAVGGHSFSVGFMLQDYEFKKDAKGAEYLQVNRGDLFEVSLVPFPANENAVMQ
ncbi:HK97 family phage prohead protease [Mesorhizobium marinum]|uniref:HK97 family phage prohead protease n=1 Tax=Mesorhizobium marinum TaxID=3228790 RepID=A0ABV3R121_9HYPH